MFLDTPLCIWHVLCYYKGMNQRKIAIKILIDILEKGGYNNIVLKKTLEKYANLEPFERAFITDIVNGTLRNIIHIDHIINQFSKTKTDRMNILVLYVLRISVYQIFFSKAKDNYAYVNEAVNIVKQKHPSLAGFVNGILRNIIRNQDKIKYPKDKLENLSIQYSTNMWLIQYLSSFLTESQVVNLCKSTIEPPKISICVNSLITSRDDLIEELQKEGVEAIAGNNSSSIFVTKTKDISELDSFKRGHFHIMDEISMKAVEELAPKPNAIMYDLCAAPGGKSFYASMLMRNTGKIFSNDIHSHKINLIKQGAKRLGISNIETKISDATQTTLQENMADYVLLDAPCSGFGTLKKKPDIKYTKTMKHVEELAIIQKKILTSSANYTKIGGDMLYSTCTVSIEENQKNIAWFLDRFDYKLVSENQYIPEEYGDGFYTALLRRNS